MTEIGVVKPIRLFGEMILHTHTHTYTHSDPLRLLFKLEGIGKIQSCRDFSLMQEVYINITSAMKWNIISFFIRKCN